MNTQKAKSVQELSVNGKNYHYSSLKNLSEKGVITFLSVFVFFWRMS